MTAASLYTLPYAEELEGAQGVNGVVVKYDLCCSCAHYYRKVLPCWDFIHLSSQHHGWRLLTSGKLSHPYVRTPCVGGEGGVGCGFQAQLRGGISYLLMREQRERRITEEHFPVRQHTGHQDCTT